MKKTFVLLAALVGCSLILRAQHSLIPTPVSYTAGKGQFMLDGKTTLHITPQTPEMRKLGDHYKEAFGKFGLQLGYGTGKGKAVSLLLNRTPNAQIGSEGYQLAVTPQAVQISANEVAGLFRALQTLRQLLPANAQAGSSLTMPACQITDYPRFGWRGLMLDVSRHFFTKDEVKQYIDKMAEYKFNTFHWHLTDDNGWRVQIKSYPKLTDVGAWRVERHGWFGGRKEPQEGEATPYGGFYTQDDIREVVQYAADRHITIVPEIDVPGHSMAALAAYPELATDGKPKFVNPGTKFAVWGEDGHFKMLVDNTLNPANEKVYEFLDKVLGEVAALFPGKYLHVGGDEAYHGYWEADPAAQALMKEKGMKDGKDLQSYFMKRVEKIVSSKGKKMIGWDEILDGGLADGAAVMSWRGNKGGIAAAKQGHDVVMSPNSHAYLDFTQGDHSLELPIYADLSLRKTYDFEPIPEGVDPKYILGGQGNLWTEQVPTLRHAFYMTYPRSFALAETLWSPKETRNWPDFIGRVENHFTRFDTQKQAIAKAVYDPIVQAKKEDGKLMLTLASDIPNTEVYYTLNNTFPDGFSARYTQPIAVPEGDVNLRVMTYRNGQPIGRMIQLKREELEKRAAKRK